MYQLQGAPQRWTAIRMIVGAYGDCYAPEHASGDNLVMRE